MATLASKSPAEFRQKCGSYFVSAVTTGGELDGFVSIETTNRQEKEALSAMFNAEYGTFKASGQIDTNLQQEISKRQRHIKVHEVGGTTATVETPEELVAKFKGFAESIATGNARPYRASLQSYQTLPNYPAASQLSETERELDKIMTFALQYMTLLEDISYTFNHKEQFFMPGGAAEGLKSLRDDIKKDLDLAEAEANKCRKGGACSVPALRNPDDFRSQLPLRYKSTCPTTQLDLQPIEIKAQQLVRGDAEMKGHNPKITMDVRIEQVGSRLMLNGTLKMEEDRKDYTTFTGSVSTVVYDTVDKPDLTHCAYALDKIGPKEGKLVANGGKDNHDPTSYGGTGLITTALCISDTVGNDAGKLGCKNVTFNKLNLVFLHEEDTLPASQIQARKAENVRKYHDLGTAIMKSKGIEGKTLAPTVQLPRERREHGGQLGTPPPR
ncbi:MAG TPA: hypothetical protein VJU54_02415, partial [Nitrospiraceae bacterium]|nr:hypothetical protein [Nitrospiraceae bacterium]